MREQQPLRGTTHEQDRCQIPSHPQAIHARRRIVGVADGDTITVLDANRVQHKIRLQGIDAPEKDQAYGEKSKQILHALVHDKTVQVDYTKSDKYGRIVGKVMLNSVDVCHQQIISGMAWHYKKYQDDQTPEDRQTYRASEIMAQGSGIGLWTDSQPIPPWEHRRIKKAQQ